MPTSGRAFPDHLSQRNKSNDIAFIQSIILTPPKWSWPMKQNLVAVLFVGWHLYIYATSTLTIIPASTSGRNAKAHHVLQEAQQIGAGLSLGDCKGFPTLRCSCKTLQNSNDSELSPSRCWDRQQVTCGVFCHVFPYLRKYQMSCCPLLA